MEIYLLGATGVHVNVTTVLELELGIELELVPTHPHLAMEEIAEGTSWKLEAVMINVVERFMEI